MDYQPTSVGRRQFFYASLTTNEIIDDRHRKKTDGVVVKLDVEKVFDKVDLDYLDELLKIKGIGKK